MTPTVVAGPSSRYVSGGARPDSRGKVRYVIRLPRQIDPEKWIPDNDLRIAALAIRHDLVLLTRDRHFESIPQLLRG
jgi:predicted nucleic acid-binding protein